MVLGTMVLGTISARVRVCACIGGENSPAFRGTIL